MPADSATYRARRARAAERARAAGFGAVLVSPGSDLAYLSGHRIHASERLTCLVLDADGGATLVVPRLEAPRARTAAPGIDVREWAETEDPVGLVAGLVPRAGSVAVDDRMWASFVLRLRAAVTDRAFELATRVTAPLRARKDDAEIGALRAVAEAADRAYGSVQRLAFAGRTERDVSREIGELLRREGHDEVGFAIVGSGPNGASPHHESGDRRIADGDAVVLDFGGVREWYCSDITRTVRVGGTNDPEIGRVHDTVRRSQEAGYRAAREGVAASAVDAAARAVIDDAGYGAYFVHRLGHGIGLDGHEHPYLVTGNDEPLAVGMAFSIEPGIYLPGRFGVRIEDVAYIAAHGRAEPLNRADHALAVVA
jgi:D-alanyl-D-alanine dipeptidase